MSLRNKYVNTRAQRHNFNGTAIDNEDRKEL